MSVYAAGDDVPAGLIAAYLLFPPLFVVHYTHANRVIPNNTSCLSVRTPYADH